MIQMIGTKLGYTKDGLVFFVILYKEDGQDHQMLYYFGPDEAIQMGREFIETGQEAKGVKNVGHSAAAN